MSSFDYIRNRYNTTQQKYGKKYRYQQPTQEEETPQDEGIFSNIVKGFKSGGASAMAGGIGMVQAAKSYFEDPQDEQHIKDMQQLEAWKKSWQSDVDANKRSRDWTFDDIVESPLEYATSGSGLAYDIGNQGAFMAATMPVGSLGGMVAKSALGMAGKQLGKTATGALIGGASGIPEAQIEGGTLYNDLVAKGMNPQEAALLSMEATAKNIPVSVLSNAIQMGKLGEVVEAYGKGRTGSRIGNAIKGGLTNAAVGGATSGAEEIVQEGITGQLKGDRVWDFYSPSTWGNPLSEEQKTAGIVGSIGGGLFSGVPGTIGGALAPKAKQTEQPKEEKKTSNLVDNMRDLKGKIGYYADDGTNCMRTIGMALKGTPFEGQINVNQTVATANELGILHTPDNYIPKAGDIAVVNDGNHAVMVTEKGGTIQNGQSHNGVYESDVSPMEMFGGVKYYISTSRYADGMAQNEQTQTQEQVQEQPAQEAKQAQPKQETNFDFLDEEADDLTAFVRRMAVDGANPIDVSDSFYDLFENGDADGKLKNRKKAESFIKKNYGDAYDAYKKQAKIERDKKVQTVQPQAQQTVQPQAQEAVAQPQVPPTMFENEEQARRFDEELKRQNITWEDAFNFLQQRQAQAPAQPMQQQEQPTVLQQPQESVEPVKQFVPQEEKQTGVVPQDVPQVMQPTVPQRNFSRIGSTQPRTNATKNPRLVDMTRRALGGDQEALANLGKLRPNVQEELKAVVLQEQRAKEAENIEQAKAVEKARQAEPVQEEQADEKEKPPTGVSGNSIVREYSMAGLRSKDIFHNSSVVDFQGKKALASLVAVDFDFDEQKGKGFVHEGKTEILASKVEELFRGLLRNAKEPLSRIDIVVKEVQETQNNGLIEKLPLKRKDGTYAYVDARYIKYFDKMHNVGGNALSFEQLSNKRFSPVLVYRHDVLVGVIMPIQTNGIYDGTIDEFERGALKPAPHEQAKQKNKKPSQNEPNKPTQKPRQTTPTIPLSKAIQERIGEKHRFGTGEGLYNEIYRVDQIGDDLYYVLGAALYKIDNHETGESKELDQEIAQIKERYDRDVEKENKKKAEEDAKREAMRVGGYTDNMTPIQRGKVAKVLNKKYTFSVDGKNKLMSIADYLRYANKNGYVVKSEKVKTSEVKETSSQQFERVKQGKPKPYNYKTEYRLYGNDPTDNSSLKINKTEADYFEWLSANQPKQEQQAAPKESPQFQFDEDADEQFFKMVEEDIREKEAQEEARKKPFKIVDDSDEAYEKSLAELKKVLNNISSNAMFNPDLHKAAFKFGVICLQRGANTFADWSAKMVDAVGEQIRPWLGGVWKSIDTYPKDLELDETKMAMATNFVGREYSKGVRGAGKIYQALVNRVGADRAKAYRPLIESAYAGIDELYNPTMTAKTAQDEPVSAETTEARETITQEENEPVSEAESAEDETYEPTFTLNDELEGIEIRFGEKPPREFLDKLKNAGYRWNGKGKKWWSKRTEKAMEFAESIGYERVVEDEPKTEGETSPVVEKEQQTGASVQTAPTVQDEGGQVNEQELRRESEGDVSDSSEERSGSGGSGLSDSTSTPRGEENVGDRDSERGVHGTVKEKLTPSQKKNAKASETPGHNFTIKEDSEIGEGGLKTKYENNVKAIKLLKQLEADGRQATPAEQKILAKYVGWGGLAPVFNVYGNDRAEPWVVSARKELKEILTQDEWFNARQTTTSAFYTPVHVVKSLWDIMKRLGFKSGRVLDPSMGVGNFFGVMPESMRKDSALTGVEIDSLTGRIAKQLYQKANIEVKGYEDTTYPDNFFDLAITNVPFITGVKPNDKKYNKANLDIHDYFFVKTVEQVRPGGIICFITSPTSMRGSDAMRKLIEHKVDFVGAIHLPEGTFKGNANTDVDADVIILQKREEGAPPSKNNHAWLDTRVVNGRYEVNEYYADNPNMVIGEWAMGGRFGNTIVAKANGIHIEDILKELVKKFPKNIYEAQRGKRNLDSIESAKASFLAPSGTRQGAFVVKDGKAYMNDQGKLVELPTTGQKKYLSYIKLRDITKKLLAEQIDSNTNDARLAELRKELNDVYDSFVKDHGYVNETKNARTLSDDPEYGVVTSIEEYKEDKKKKTVKVKKREIFTKRTVNAIAETKSAETPADALALSLTNIGSVDIPYMAKLLNQSEKEVVKSLDGVIYQNPSTQGYETADEYLSGNVREKLEYAKEATKTNDAYQKNVEALEKVQPADLIAEDIDVNLGVSWIPASDIQDFAAHLLGTSSAPIKVDFISELGRWKTDWRLPHFSRFVSATETWGTNRRNFIYILEDALNQKSPVIYDTLDDKKRVVNPTETVKAQQKVAEVKAEFKKWLWQDKDRKERLLAYYNRTFNNMRLREYDGSHLTLPGYSAVAPQLRQHQKDAVWRIMQRSNTLIAHCVGAGKTWTMQTAAMEMKRLGIAKKSMFVIPNHMVAQFENEFRVIYPNAKLLTISTDNLPSVKVQGTKGISKSELAKRKAINNAQRQKTLAQIATEDWDGIIISHNMFTRIPMSPETTAAFYQEEIDKVERGIVAIRQEQGRASNAIVKEMAKKVAKLKENLDKSLNEDAKDIVIPFEQLGVDQIFVDEADLFKNLGFVTSMGNISGMSNTNSQRSTDMFLKTQWLTKANGGRGVVFATGTPISNTMAEMFTMLRYLDMQGLKEKNVDYFDAWASTFTKMETVIERSPDGQGYRQVEKFTSFVNMPELVKMFRKVTDVKTQDELDLDIPKLKNGKPTIVEIEMNDSLEVYIKEEAKKRAEAIRQRRVDPSDDNMLKLTGDLRKASLDIRLVDPTVPAEVADGKINAVVDKLYETYQRTNETNGVQVVFCDLSTPKGASNKEVDLDKEVADDTEPTGNITVYDEIKRKLVEKGVPKEKIAFAHDAKTKEQKEALFQKVRDSEVRIIIGSTEKMGAGTNFQNNLVALHHVDAPWRPRDIEQREGRILRQGNQNKEVEIFNYVTKGSFDANMWEKLKNKATMIRQAMSNNLTERSVEDEGATVLSFAEVEALASGNPLMAERTMVNAQINKYETLKRSNDVSKRNLEAKVKTIPLEIAHANEMLKSAKNDETKRIDIAGDNFKMVLNGQTFTKRADAKEALSKAVAECTNTEDKTVGSIGGFELKLRLVKAGRSFKHGGKIYVAERDTVRASVIGNMLYSCDTSLQSIEYAATNGPKKAVDQYSAAISRLEKELKDSEDAIGKPFEYEEKLQQLKNRLAEIDEDLGDLIQQPTQEAQDVQEAEIVEDVDESHYKASATSDETYKRSVEEVKAELKKALPTATFTKDDGDIIATIGDKKVRVSVRDNIILNEKEKSRARKAHGLDDDVEIVIQGSWRKVNKSDIDGILTISQDSEEGSSYHEVMHMAMDMALTPKERKVLEKHYAKDAVKENKTLDEAIADGYAEWKLAREKGKGTLLGKLFRKLHDFLHKMQTVFTGIENAHNVMRRIESGEVWGLNTPPTHEDVAEAKLKEDEANFAKIVDSWTNLPKRGESFVMYTPLALEIAGITHLPIKIKNKTFEHILVGHKDSIGKEELKKIPRALTDPLFVAESNGNILIALDLGDKNNVSIVTFLLEKKDNTGNNANFILSSYGKDSAYGKADVTKKTNYKWFIDNFLNTNKVRYINKKKTTEWLREARLKPPYVLNGISSLSTNNIPNENDLRKRKEEMPAYYHVTVSHVGNGYHGWSKSNNAVSAEEDGRFPATVAAKKLGVKTGAIKLYIPTDEWHHTSNHYNKTYYYDIADLLLYKEGGRDALVEEGYDKEDIDRIEKQYNDMKAYKEPKAEEKVYRADVRYVVWGGTRNHPTANEQVYKDIVVREKGSFYTFTLPDGTTVKKKMDSNGTYVDKLPTLEEAQGYRDTLDRAGEETRRFVDDNYDDFEVSMSGTVYPVGRKPSARDYENPSEFFKKGETILRNENGKAVLQEWTGDKWETVEESTGVSPQGLMYARKQLGRLGDTNTEKIHYSIRQTKKQKANSPTVEDLHESALKRLIPKIFRRNKTSVVVEQAKDAQGDSMNLLEYAFASPSRIAERIPAFKRFFTWGQNAMEKEMKLRTWGGRHIKAAFDLVKDKEDREDLFSLLWAGDAEGKEWTKEELLVDGIKESVADAYIGVRRVMTRFYNEVNKARTRKQTKTARVSPHYLELLKENSFVEIISETEMETENGDKEVLVTYDEYPSWEKEYNGITQEELDSFKSDNAMQIVKTTEKVGADGNPLYDVVVRERVGDMNKLTGYIPHFFHNFFIVAKMKDEDGEIKDVVVGSAKNQKDAVKQAEDFQKKQAEEGNEVEMIVRPKQFDFTVLGMNESYTAAVVGDNEYDRMVKKLQKENDMSITEAKEMLSGVIKKKGRSRFFGNMLQRKGVAGFEKDMGWVLNHFVNSASRYVALETEFKPKAISYYERRYGRYDSDPQSLHANRTEAKYVKQYISDLNGNPSWLEEVISKWLKRIPWLGKQLSSAFGERYALHTVNTLTSLTTYAKLGCLNISSALLNLSQTVNSTALIGSIDAIPKEMAKLTAAYAGRYKLTPTEKKVLVKTGVLEDIGLDSGSGYDRVRSAKQTVHALGQASMYAFKKTEELVRRATVLAAYKKGIERGMSDKEAIEYAKEINRKANFDYGVHDAPNIFRRGSVLSQIMLQFKKYGIKEMELMWEMTPFLNKNSNVSKKQKALFWGGYYLLAGMFQIPLVGWLDDVMDGLFGVKPTLWSKKAIYDTFGYDDPAVNVATRGVLSLGGIDASARLGLADVMPRLEYRTLFGATLSSPVSAMQALWRGDIEASVRALSPGVANLISAAYGERLGKRNRVQGKYDTATERAIRAIGFQTVEESMASERKQLESYAKTKLSKEKQEAIDDYLEAEAEGEDVIPYARRLRELNVSPKTVQEERKRKKMTEAEIREEKAKEKKKQRKQKEISLSEYAKQ